MTDSNLRIRGRTLRAAAVAGLLALAVSSPAYPHVRETPDNVLASIGVDERLGAAVPSDLAFTDQDGKTVRLASFLGKGPVILTLNYFTCPMLCPLTLRNYLSAAESLPGISLARDFRIVTVSIDPQEGPEAARDRSRELYGGMTGIADPADRWPFLRGGAAQAQAITAAVGFRYRKVGAEFAHPDVAVVLTPGGRISRYLYGIAPAPRDLKLALVEAAGGRIGESRASNQILLFCYHYDPVERKYALYARNIMKAGGVLTVAFLGGLYLVLWRGRRRKALTTGSREN